MKVSSIVIKILLPLVLGGAILYWMYRGFDFSSIRHVLLIKNGLQEKLFAQVVAALMERGLILKKGTIVFEVR